MSGDNRTLTVTIVGNPNSAVQALGHTGKAVDDLGAKADKSGERIKKGIGGALGQISNSGVLGPLSEVFNGLNEAIDKSTEKHAALGVKMIAVGGIAAGLGSALAAEGSKDQAAQQQLQQAIENTGHSYEDYKEKVEQTISSQAKFGHGAVDVQNALQSLTQATNSPTKALADMGLTADLAAAKHETLTAAADQLAKVLNGKGARTLASYGISMKDANGKTKDMDEVTKELADKLKGQASAAADTFSGKLAGLKTELANNVAQIGEKYGPALTALGGVVTVAGAGMEIAAGAAGKMAANSAKAAEAAKALRVATLMATGATEAEAVAQAELDVTMDANPIGLIVLAVTALVTGLVLAYTKCKTFRDIVNSAFTSVGDTAKFMWNDVLKPTFRFIVEAFLKVAGSIVHGAASAFGWVPHVGGKLQAAAKSFDSFAASVNASLSDIKDRAVTVNIKTVQTVLTATVSDAMASSLQSTRDAQVPSYTNTAYGQGGLSPSQYANLIPTDYQAKTGATALRGVKTYQPDGAKSPGGGGGGGGGSSAPTVLTKAQEIAKAMASHVVKALEAEGPAYEKANKKLQASVDAKKKILADALKVQKDYATSIAQAASAGALAGIKGDTNEDGSVAAVNQGNIKSGLQAKLAGIQSFLANIKALGVLGLSKALMGQIFAMGPDAGGPYAAAILAGGQDAVNTDNSLQSSIDATANSLGDYAGQNQYGMSTADKNAIRTTIQKLEINIAGNVTAEADLAEKIAKAVKEAIAKDDKRNGK